MMGIEVTDILTFIEREASKIDVDLLQPNWIAFSDSYVTTATKALTKRTFDLIAASTLLLLVWPLILVTGLLIALSSRFQHPVLY